MKSKKMLVVKESVSYTASAGLSATSLGHEAPLYSTFNESRVSRVFSSFPNEPSASHYPYGNPYNPSAGVSPPFALIIVLSLSIFFFVGSLSICVRICGGHGDTDENSRNAGNERRNRASQGLDKSTIETFPIFTYSLAKGLKREKQAQECAVCLSEYEDDERLRLLPKCGHAFHLDCIDMWLFSHTSCPLCRYSLDSEVEEQGSGVNVEDHIQQQGPLQAAEQVAVIVVGAENTVQERVAHQSRGRNEMNPFDAGLDLTSPGQARIYNGRTVSATDSPILGIMSGLRPLEKGNKKFRRSHSTGHSLVRVGGNPEHPCAFYISTDDRYVLNFTGGAVEPSKAVLHKCSSYASFCYSQSSSSSEVTLNHQAPDCGL